MRSTCDCARRCALLERPPEPLVLALVVVVQRDRERLELRGDVGGVVEVALAHPSARGRALRRIRAGTVDGCRPSRSHRRSWEFRAGCRRSAEVVWRACLAPRCRYACDGRFNVATRLGRINAPGRTGSAANLGVMRLVDAAASVLLSRRRPTMPRWIRRIDRVGRPPDQRLAVLAQPRPRLQPPQSRRRPWASLVRHRGCAPAAGALDARPCEGWDRCSSRA